MSYQAVRKWIKGETMRVDGEHLIKLANLTGYDAQWIILGTGPKVRVYARTPAQAQTLIAMQSMPPEDEHKVPEIAHLLSQHRKKESNGWQ